MTPAEPTRWKQLEVARRRPLGQAAHPDDCLSLTVRGVDWAVPSRGMHVVPRFRDGAAVLSVEGEESWPEAARLIEAVRRVKQDRPCPRCGRPVASHVPADSTGSHLDVLAAAAALAAKALRVQYDLSDDELSELLSFECPDVPRWCGQIIRWAAGLDTRTHGRTDHQPGRPRWWRFWRRWT